MSEIPRQNPLQQSINTYKEKGRKEKQILSRGGYWWEGKRRK
jgi:hypothetical protein